MAHFCAAATRPSGRSAWSIIPPPLTRSEWQIRAALHWHLALWGLEIRNGRDLRAFQKWLSRSWFKCVGSGDERHLRAGTQIVTARKARGVLSYLGKEIGKSHQGACEAAAEEFGSVGRPWGIINRTGLRAHQGEIEVIKVSGLELLEIAVEIARRSLAAGGGSGHSWRSGLCCKPDVGVSQIRTTTVLSSCFCVGQTVL